MKNSASELYTIDHAPAYQHAFGYVRQLAILLRNSLKVKSKVRRISLAIRLSTCAEIEHWILGIVQASVQLAVRALYRLLDDRARAGV